MAIVALVVHGRGQRWTTRRRLDLILRHDVDMCLSPALEMAQLEAAIRDAIVLFRVSEY